MARTRANFAGALTPTLSRKREREKVGLLSRKRESEKIEGRVDA